MAGQLVSNSINGRPLGEGLGGAALLGGAIGGLFGAASAGLSGGFDGAAAGAITAEEDAAAGAAGADEGASAAAAGGDSAGADGAGLAGGGCAGGLSFAASTLVATPSGERPISSLKVGDPVLAYNPTTGKSETEPIQAVWLNHDHDLVDVGLRDTTTTSTTSTTTPTAAASRTSGTPVSSSTSTTTRPTQGAARLSRTLRGVSAAIAVALAITLSNAAPAQAATATTTTTTLSSPTPTETIHTTANHPWLTTDRVWAEAGDLQPGEHVVTLAGGTATVVWVHVVAGRADMYNLTVASDHTYAVGASRAVVHNEGPCQVVGDPSAIADHLDVYD